jgi:hypothetical protein
MPILFPMPLSTPKELPMVADMSLLKASIPGFQYVARKALVSAIMAFPLARARESAKDRENRRAIIKKIKGTRVKVVKIPRLGGVAKPGRDVG